MCGRMHVYFRWNKFALVEVLSLNLKSVPDGVFMSILRGMCGTVKLARVFEFPGGKPDQRHVDKRFLRGQGLQ